MIASLRRSSVNALVASALALGAVGCAGLRSDFQREFTPGQLQAGSHAHAFQTASFAYAFTQGHLLQLEARLQRVERDMPAFFEAIDRAGWVAGVSVVPHQSQGKDSSYEYYDVDLVLTPKDPKAHERFVLPGAEGTEEATYDAALAPAAERIGVPADVLRRGHFALFGLATLSGALNATDDSMKRHAFALLVLKKRLERGDEHVDPLAPLRPASESIEDVDLALRVIADHHRTTSRLRAEVIGLTALARLAGDAQVRGALFEQVGESKRAARAWLDAHDRPTTEQYGVGMKALELPTPENMLAVLDKEGYLTAAVEVAEGIATGDPASTLEALGKLAPEGSSLRIASEGTAAALRGDVRKATDAALQLAEKQEDVASLAARLRAAERAARDTAQGVTAVAKEAPRGAAAGGR